MNSKTVCTSCVFGKHVRGPFVSFNNATMKPFNILHSGLWTSQVFISAGHCYYVLFLDNCFDFLSNVFNVIMGENMTIHIFIIIVLLMISFFISLSLTLHQKMVRQNEKYALLTT